MEASGTEAVCGTEILTEAEDKQFVNHGWPGQGDSLYAARVHPRQEEGL